MGDDDDAEPVDEEAGQIGRHAGKESLVDVLAHRSPREDLNDYDVAAVRRVRVRCPYSMSAHETLPTVLRCDEIGKPGRVCMQTC